MSLFKKLLITFSLVGAILVPVTATHAQYGLEETAGASGLKDKYASDVPTLIGNVIGTALSMIAVIFFILMVYGGFLWMTAHGDSGQVDKAKDTIVAAIIGIIVVLASYAITRFVFSAADNQAGAGGGAGGGPAATVFCYDPRNLPAGCARRDACLGGEVSNANEQACKDQICQQSAGTICQ